jgi:hypothetical protein
MNGPKIIDPKNPFNESPEAAQARRRRSLFLALGLVAFIIIVFIVTIVKLKGNVLGGSPL